MLSFKEYLSEAVVKSIDKSPSDKITTGLRQKGTIERSTKFELTKPSRKTVQIKGNKGTISFDVNTSFSSIVDIDITKIQQIEDYDVYEFYWIKGNKGYFDITTPNGGVIYRVHFSDMQRQF